MAVEQSWNDEGRASAETLRTRMARFPRGFLVGCLEHEGRGRIVATVTSMPLRYRPGHAADFRNWNEVTNHGLLHEATATDANALYIVSGVIDREFRGHAIFAPGILAQVGLARELGLRHVLAGAVIPGYRSWCEKNGETDAWRYCSLRRGRHLVDPLLAMYEAIGFHVPDAAHVLPDYFPDYASRDHAALVVRDLDVD